MFRTLRTAFYAFLGYMCILALAGCGSPDGPRQTVGDTWNNQTAEVQNAAQTQAQEPQQSDSGRHFLMVSYTTQLSVPEANCVGVGGSFTAEFLVDLPQDWNTHGARVWTEIFTVVSYNPSKDEVTIASNGAQVTLVRGQPNYMEFLYVAMAPWGEQVVFHGVKDFFVYSGVSGNDPSKVCFGAVGGQIRLATR